MSSGPLSPSNDYQFPPHPIEARLDRDTWNLVFKSLGERLRDLEAQRVEIEAVIDELQLFGLDRLNQALNPAIEQAQAQLDALEGQIADVQTLKDQLLGAGIPADNITQSATRVFVTPEQKAEIAALRSALDTLTAGSQAAFDTLGEIATAIQSKQAALGFTPEDAAKKGQANGYASLDSGSKLPQTQNPGSRVLLGETVVSTAVQAITFTSIPSGYSAYEVELEGLRVSATASIEIQFSTDGATWPTAINATGGGSANGIGQLGTGAAAAFYSVNYMRLTDDFSSIRGAEGIIKVLHLQAARMTTVLGFLGIRDLGAGGVAFGICVSNAQSVAAVAHTALRLGCRGNNFTAGAARLWGVK